MKRHILSAMALAVLAALPLVPADAQRGPRRPHGAPRFEGVERLLRMRERLELTDEQVAQLEVLRREALERRQARMAELMELQSRLRAGDATRDELREKMSERREVIGAELEQRRDRINAILTEEQRERLHALRPPHTGLRRGVWPGRHRGRGPAMRGFRGRGLAPRPFLERRGVGRFGWRRQPHIGRRFKRGPIR